MQKKEQVIGQLLSVGLAGPRLLKKEIRFLRQVSPAGVVYFRRNVVSVDQLAALSDAVWRQLKGFRPFVAIDQEGGRVNRIGPPFSIFPGNDFLGRAYRRTQNALLARKQATALAKELLSVGVNFNFSPVADVDSNPKNPIIGTRSFGSKPTEVAHLVAETIKAYRRSGMICCAKHFPGHGDTFLDSHKALPVVRATRYQLWRRELLPFRAAVLAGVPTIMTAHAIFPALDADHPATLSKKVLQGVLRKRLGFDGLIVSDDMEMAAISAHGRVEEAAVEAVAAGVDQLLICQSMSLAALVHQALCKEWQKSPAFATLVQDALRRVQRVKKRYLLRPYSRPRRSSVFRWPEHGKLVGQITQEGRTKLVEAG